MPHIEVELESVPLHTPHRLEREGQGIVVVRTAGLIYAFRDECPHAGWRLSDGEFVDGALECAGHGWEFDLATGRCDTVPAYCLKPVTVKLTCLPVGGIVVLHGREL